MATKKKKDVEQAEQQQDNTVNEAVETVPEFPEGTVILEQQPAAPDPKEEIARLEDQLLRAYAEMQNLRRRTEKDVDDARKYAISNISQDLIGVLESLYMAEESVKTEDAESNPLLKTLLEGVKLTKNELVNVFGRYGIKRIYPLGEKFDHNFHQAVTQIPDASKEPNTVIAVVQAGYTIKERLLRPALVAVSTAMN